MSLGIKSLWRARGYTTRAGGLSLIPREQSNPLYQESNLSRWASVVNKDTKTELTSNDATNELLKGKSQSFFTRVIRKRVIKKRSGFQPKVSELVKRPIRYPIKKESRRSLRKHRNSAARQHLYDSAREASSKPLSSWHSTFDFMLRHTIDIREILHFQVIIGKGVAAEARRILSEPDTHISQICRRNESLVRIEETNPDNGELILSLSGSEDSIRKSLLDIVGAVGKITAVRISNQTLGSLLLDVWKGATEKRPEIRLLGDGEVAVDDKTLTVHASLSNSAKYKGYRLTKRADQINRPTEWTQDSFEKYVAALVCGQVPTHLARSLYPEFPDHQETVVSLLTELFTSEHTRSGTSLSALKMAINYIESRGSGFRQASRTIFNQAEMVNLSMDAEVFNIFLVSASKAGDLDGFNSILRAMVRKGYPPQGRSWVAFMEMIQSPAIKRYIVARLRTKGLNRNPSTLCAIGKQMAIIDLERHISTEFNVKAFVHEQNKKYGSRWLDTITTNRIIDVLGAHKNLDACNALLDLLYTTGITSPDDITLNTILTHTKNFAQQLAFMKSILERWPKLSLRADTYHILFRAAWERRYPNMLRVIFRYAVLARRTTPKIRYTLTRLLAQEDNLSNRRGFLKAWEDVIFGQTELAEMRAIHADSLRVVHMIRKYVEQAQDKKLKDEFIDKLEEAIEMDMTIHQLLKDGMIQNSSASVRESLSVPLPLVDRTRPWNLISKVYTSSQPIIHKTQNPGTWTRTLQEKSKGGTA
ncbi:hypothetical protein F5Y11DRAFT_308595 [Daldinia sp. FL1419]|nr:hypothetical protein F5Y11DRAFT_308595 [Daldinia sp. FL1419]